MRTKGRWIRIGCISTSSFADCRFAPCSETDRLAVPHGLETLWHGELYRESFAPSCWLTGRTPTFQLGHDGEAVGEVNAVVAHREWHHATLVLEDRPVIRERVRAGAPISVCFRSLKRDKWELPRVLRHRLCFLDHIALLERNDVPGHIGAQITHIWEPPTATEPASAARTVDGITLEAGESLEDVELGVVYRNVGGRIEQRPFNPTSGRVQRHASLSYRELSGHEMTIEVPTERDYREVESLRRNGLLAWVR